jgi:hypothetical protein
MKNCSLAYFIILLTLFRWVLYLRRRKGVGNCINEPTRFGALLDPIIYSDECEISFLDVMQIDRNISDHDATSASLRIPYNLQAKYP